MISDRPEAPEADRVEQSTCVVADDSDDTQALSAGGPLEADTADAWEQAVPVSEADDDGYDYTRSTTQDPPC